MSEFVDQTHKREALGGAEDAEESSANGSGLSWSPPLPWGPFRHWQLRRLKEHFPLVSWPEESSTWLGSPEAVVGAACFATGILTGGGIVALAMSKSRY